MYSKEIAQCIQAVEAARKANIAYEPARMTAEEKEQLLAAYHPDYKKSEFSTLAVGANKGEKVPHELCEMLQANSRIRPGDVDLSFDFGARYLPFRRLASMATCGCEIPAGQRDEQMPHITQSNDSSAHLAYSPR